LANYLAQEATSANVPPARQSTLDSRVRDKIQLGVAKLKEKETEIEHEIQSALDKETLGKTMEENDQIVDGKVRSSLSLQNDLNEIRQKVDRYHQRKEFEGVKEAEQKAQAVAECYKFVVIYLKVELFSEHAFRAHSTTSLECWKEVEDFKIAVTSVEKVTKHYFNHRTNLIFNVAIHRLVPIAVWRFAHSKHHDTRYISSMK
jgi:MICOS complex subunit MIC19